MSEIRQNIITRDWVIIATERAKRPDEFANKKKSLAAVPPHRADCPFCVGNEEDGTLETCRLADDFLQDSFALRTAWKVRAIGNKYPALSPTAEPMRISSGIHRIMSGIGFHEVIVEHPRHDLTTALLTVEEVTDILFVYRHRYLEIRKYPYVETIVIFKNHGESAGTSLEHPHSQIAATPVVPNQFRTRIDEAIRYFDDTGECMFCRTLEDELAAGERVIFESEHFVAFIPFAALSPFHIWIFPRRHSSSFDDINDAEITDLADTLKTVLAKLYYGLNDPDYNYNIRSVPTAERATKYFHWYIAIIPRVSKQAGFELGSGMFINTALPEESAQFLRSTAIPGDRNFGKPKV
ncbi:galactose-1-phosphate uridylyltransferase [Microcoleus sp. LEGE 07076]|uniref:galactose-1-phosphate uridylyltransferase n=1 Tax=Microcoleus sp. LEGE 07076 TaxID=915322 RepID=UPI001880B5DD|nr:galactose-1-phosphate uridylyltransferase [Microcoleus sp. LEGE 07076]MBE9183155.1 galactose-1-phosphate uridylyltransferase [Microcoleus sp. LEGE 07076]